MPPTNREQAERATRSPQLRLVSDGVAGPPTWRFARGAAAAGRALACVSGAFDADRRSPRWDAGQPLRDETVMERVERFRPAELGDDEWGAIASTVRRVAECAASTPYRAGTLASVAAQLLAWCLREGLPLDDAVVLHPDTVDRFVAEGCRHLKAGTRLNYQSQLRRVGEQLVGPPTYQPRRVRTGGSPPPAPYTGDEVAALLGWARGLPTARMRDNVAALLAFGLGAGLTSQELNSLLGTDVARDAEGLTVDVAVGPEPRSVPMLRRWEPHAEQVLHRVGRYPVFLPGRARVNRKDISRFIDGCPTADAPRLSPQRLRVTWIVGHIRAGTRLKALEIAAGAGAAQLATYACFVEAPNSEEIARLLRDPAAE